jgi:methylenetetrahydrofolate--tRNA-(uracil-5-)-methyltransferase
LPDILIVGGGLAGCEAAWRAAAHGLRAELWEMKPLQFSPAHVNADLAELVCSNSLRSDDPGNAVGLLKEELRRLGSLIVSTADETRVPAGGALAVDRERFSRAVTEKIRAQSLITVVRGERRSPWPTDRPTVVAAGPLASAGLAADLAELTGRANLHFYDALAPIVVADSLDARQMFAADRYGRGPGDHLNCPMTAEQFATFCEALVEADRTRPRPFEDERHFEGCLPIEVMAQRGLRTLTFGPLKPVGLEDPRDGRRPAAVVQLRRENEAGTMWNLVGFQTRLTRPAQERVFRLIPGLERAEFARYGAIHRNTYLEAPVALDSFQRFRRAPRLFAAGQISGVEGYVESAAQGLWAGENAARAARGLPLVRPPRATALGSLLSHLDGGPSRVFAPSNVNFGLFPPPEGPKRERAAKRLAEARAAWPPFLEDIGYVKLP